MQRHQMKIRRSWSLRLSCHGLIRDKSLVSPTIRTRLLDTLHCCQTIIWVYSYALYLKKIVYWWKNWVADELDIPEGGFTWAWWKDWDFNNLRSERSQYDNSARGKHAYIKSRATDVTAGFLLFAATQYVFTDGGSKFQYWAFKEWHNILILASNVSLWIQEKSDGNGTLVQLDHRNESTRVKFTRVMKCDRMPKDKQEQVKNCTILEFKVEFNIKYLFI